MKKICTVAILELREEVWPEDVSVGKISVGKCCVTEATVIKSYKEGEIKSDKHWWKIKKSGGKKKKCFFI